MCRRIRTYGLSASPKGGSPLSSAYSTPPSAYRSHRASTRSPRHCSGAMYGGLPKIRPVTVQPAVASEECAMPKSQIFSRPPGSRKRLAGFKSRWITLSSCAAASASAVCAARSSATATGIPPGARISAVRRSSPASSSMTMKSRPSSWPTSCTTVMPGCWSRAPIVASRRKRATSSSFVAASSSTFTATARSSAVSRARHTSPMPPWPSRCSRRYRPAS